MDIRMIGIEQLARIGQEDLRGSAGRYRQRRPSRIIGLVARIAGVAADGATAVERWATASAPGSEKSAPRDRAAAR
jgi:hypothetical protein